MIVVWFLKIEYCKWIAILKNNTMSGFSHWQKLDHHPYCHNIPSQRNSAYCFWQDKHTMMGWVAAIIPASTALCIAELIKWAFPLKKKATITVRAAVAN